MNKLEAVRLTAKAYVIVSEKEIFEAVEMDYEMFPKEKDSGIPESIGGGKTDYG